MTAFRDVELVMVDPRRLVELPGNPNKLSPRQVESLRRSIRELGFIEPVVLRRGEAHGELILIDGAHRRAIAVEEGLDRIPALVVSTDRAGAVQAARIALNWIRGHVEIRAAGDELVALAGMGWSLEDLMVTGLAAEDIGAMLGPAQPEDVLADVAAAVADVEEEAQAEAQVDRPWTLELQFRTRAELVQARRALRKAAGKGRPLGEGLLRLVETTG